MVLALDNAGWRGKAGLVVPDGVRLVFQPAYTPEAPPAETLGTLSLRPYADSGRPSCLFNALRRFTSAPSSVDEPVVNKHMSTIEAIDEVVSTRCAALASEREKIKSQAGFHGWPKIANPS